MRPTRFLLLLLTLALLRPADAGAQNFSLNAQATVTSSVTLVQLANLAFGATAVVPGITATVAAANGGMARIDYNEPALVTAPAFLMLTGPSGSQVRVDLACAQAPTATATAPTPFGAGCTGGFTPALSGNVGGSHFIYVGGSIAGTASTSVLAGSYAGSFSVTATYVVY